jgi:hypothetical protein
MTLLLLKIIRPYLYSQEIPSELLRFWNLFIVRNYKAGGGGTFRKLYLLSSSGEGKEMPDLLGPFERVNLNH